MANVQYGLKEVANVIFFDVATGKPAIYFDTLKVSTIENESESAEARGGRGNGRLMVWDYGRNSTLQMQDALLSDQSLAMLAGTSVQTSNIQVVEREVLTATGEPATVKLKETPIDGTVYVNKVVNGIVDEEVTAFTVNGSDVTFDAGVTTGDQVAVIYTYETNNSGATLITFSSDKFPPVFRVVGDTIVRDRNGIDRKMQFVIPKAKLQSTFSFTMDAENVSTFDFTLEVLTEAGTNKLYDIIRL